MPLESRMRELAIVIPQTLDDVSLAVAELVKDRRDDLCPVDTGALLRSGEILPGTTKGTWIVQEGAGLPDARAIYTEYGTERMDAQPHMTPAALYGRRIMAGKVKRAVMSTIRRHTR